MPLLLVTAVAVAGCGPKNEERVLFNGIYYKTKSDTTNKEDRKQFQSVVRRPEQDIRGALEAGRHEGQRYCLKNFGTSKIEWTRGPDDPGAALYVDGSRLVLTGTCVLW